MELHALISWSCDVWLGLLSQFFVNINLHQCVTCTVTIFWTPGRLRGILPLSTRKYISSHHKPFLAPYFDKVSTNLVIYELVYSAPCVWVASQFGHVNMIGEPTGSKKITFVRKNEYPIEHTLLHQCKILARMFTNSFRSFRTHVMIHG